MKKRLGADSQSLAGPELDVQATDEGILISLTDRQNYSMFAIGSAEPQPRVVRMMEAIAMSLETMPGAIVVRGHTDAHPYRSKTYDNWRLSSARAQMAYYMLNRAGMPKSGSNGSKASPITGSKIRRIPSRRKTAASRFCCGRRSREGGARNALLVGSLALAGAAGAQAQAANLSDMADDLQRIQIRMAQGDKSAYAAQLTQLKAMGAAIATAKPETWNDIGKPSRS